MVKNKFAVGDRLELILPQGHCDIVLEEMQDKTGLAIREAPGSGWQVRIPLPPTVKQADQGLIARYLN